MSGRSSPASIDVVNQLHDRIKDAVIAGIQGEPIPGVGSKDIQLACWFALDVVSPSLKTEDDADAMAYRILMPIALFLSQLAAIKEDCHIDEMPLREALVQAVSDTRSDVDRGVVNAVITAAMEKLGEMGYSISHNHDMTLNEAEAVGHKN